MLDLPRSPHPDGFLGGEIPRAFSKRMCIPLKHDQCRCAGRMSCREQRRVQRAAKCDQDRFATPEIIQYRGDAVGPLLQGRQRARRDGIGRTASRLVEEDEPTERRHRLEPPLNGRHFRNDLTAREPARDDHDVAGSFTRRPIGNPQVTVQCVARLGEHDGILSRRTVRAVRISSVHAGQKCSREEFFGQSDSRGAQALKAGEVSFSETTCYGEATAKRRHSPGTPLSSCAPQSSNSSPDPITRSRSVLDTSSGREIVASTVAVARNSVVVALVATPVRVNAGDMPAHDAQRGRKRPTRFGAPRRGVADAGVVRGEIASYLVGALSRRMGRRTGYQ
jgi:hypothetical protein